MEYGTVMLVILAVMGGFIAYLGDKIGSQVGKRRVKLLGLRPKYSSILITIITGVCIAAVTLGIMSVLSKNVRIALFGMQQLQRQKEALQEQRDRLITQGQILSITVGEKNRLIEEKTHLLQQQQVQLDGKTKQLRVTQVNLQQAQLARDEQAKQLSFIQLALKEAKRQREQAERDKNSAVADKAAAQRELTELENTKTQMVQTIEHLDKRIQLLKESMTHIREGTVMFRVGEVLSSTVVHGGGQEIQAREELSKAMQMTNRMICSQLGIRDTQAVLVYISPEEFKETAKVLQHAGPQPKLVRVIAAGNIIVGEPALVHVQLYDNKLIYRQHEVVYEGRLNPQDIRGNAELEVMRILRMVNKEARSRGVLPDPLTGNVGTLPATDMFRAITEIKQYGNVPLRITAVCAADTYTAGPLPIVLSIAPVNG